MLIEVICVFVVLKKSVVISNYKLGKLLVEKLEVIV